MLAIVIRGSNNVTNDLNVVVRESIAIQQSLTSETERARIRLYASSSPHKFFDMFDGIIGVNVEGDGFATDCNDT